MCALARFRNGSREAGEIIPGPVMSCNSSLTKLAGHPRVNKHVRGRNSRKSSLPDPSLRSGTRTAGLANSVDGLSFFFQQPLRVLHQPIQGCEELNPLLLG